MSTTPDEITVVEEDYVSVSSDSDIWFDSEVEFTSDEVQEVPEVEFAGTLTSEVDIASADHVIVTVVEEDDVSVSSGSNIIWFDSEAEFTSSVNSDEIQVDHGSVTEIDLTNTDTDVASISGITEVSLTDVHLRNISAGPYEQDVESGRSQQCHGIGSEDVRWSAVLLLAFQSLGIVYGDIGTSPLYVFAATFPDGIKHEDDLLGVLSLIIYTLTLIPVIKYLFLVLPANNNGDGGTFALYSFICRNLRINSIATGEDENGGVSTSQHEDQRSWVDWLKKMLENSRLGKLIMLLAAMLGTSMMIGDGVLSPSISVLSAVEGIKGATSSINKGLVVWISVGILVMLFFIQKYGTSKVGFFFAPTVSIWFLLLACIGMNNLIHYDYSVLKAINPVFIYRYFSRNKKEAWISLGGVVLCIAGSEALFADLSHFTVSSIRLSMLAVTYPILVVTYAGQAAYLREHPSHVSDAFYKSVPGSMHWPVVVVAVMASIIASQSMITGTFSVIEQSISLGCFPPVRVVQTSATKSGQVYIPSINYMLMVASVAVTLAFRSAGNIANAYGVTVLLGMEITSLFMMMILLMVKRSNAFVVGFYVLIIWNIEHLYTSSLLYKFSQGGYVPVAVAILLTAVMVCWKVVSRRTLRCRIWDPSRIQELFGKRWVITFLYG